MGKDLGRHYLMAGTMTEGKHIFFKDVSDSLPSRRTKVWTVHSKYPDGPSELGRIKWFARWRCYGFFPAVLTVYEKLCLRDIAQFCEEKTEEHKRKCIASMYARQSESNTATETVAATKAVARFESPLRTEPTRSG